MIIFSSKHRFAACLLALLFALAPFLWGEPCCLAQPPAVPSFLPQKEIARSQTLSEPSIAVPPLVSEQERRFDTLLNQISANGHITIIAEDKPLRPFLNEKDTFTLQDQLAATPNGATMPVSQLVDKVAAAFDYYVVRSNSSTYLLYKRYNNSYELPFVPYEEVLRCYQNLHKALLSEDAAVPVGGDTAAEKQFIESLDADAKLRLSSGGIAIADLNSQQRQWAWHYAVSYVIGSGSAAVGRNVLYLQAVRSPQSLFRRIDFFDTGLMVLSFEGPYSPNGTIWEHGLSHGFLVQNGGVSVTRTNSGRPVITGKISGPLVNPKFTVQYKQLAADLPDHDPPTLEDYAPKEPPSSHTITLSALAQQRNVAPSGSPVVPIVVDEILGSKPVTVFNEKNVTDEQLLQAVAAIYGLRVQHRQNDLFLTTRQAKPLKSISELPALIEALFPLPLRRALQGDADHTAAELIAAEEKEKPKTPITNAKAQKALEIRTKIKEQWARTYQVPRQRQEVLYRTAVHKLRVLIEPKINTSPTKRYLMRDMTDEEKRLFALICILPSLSDVNQLASTQLPRSLLNFDQAVLTGRIDTPVPGVHYLGINYRNDTGKLRSEGGMNITIGGQVSQPPAVPAAPKP